MAIYALLVGINDYQNVKKLSGCVADANAMESFLTSQFNDVKILKLLNSEATRDGIISGFETFLAQAKAGDTAFFHYSGHGSREDAPEEFHSLFPEKKNETLVCYDSRSEGGYDLADKELAVLIEIVAKNNPHIIVCLDSCHSGSATRLVQNFKNSRQVEKGGYTRPLDSYINGYYLQYLNDEKSVTKVPAAKHLALSACSSTEVAWETDNNRGLFTQTLLSILENKPKMSYGSLFEKIQIKIRQINGGQTPQVDAYGGETVWKSFVLGENLADVQEKMQVYYNKKGKVWQLKAGALQGINPTSKQDVLIYDKEVNIGVAKLSNIKLETCDLNLQTTNLEVDKTYKALLNGANPFPISIYSELTVEENKEIIPMSNYNIVENEIHADYLLKREVDGILIWHAKSKKIVFISSDKIELKSVLSEIANWENLYDLNNPNSSISLNSIKLNLGINKKGQDYNYVIEKNNKFIFDIEETILNYYGINNGIPQVEEIDFKFIISNNFNRNLFFSLIQISPLYRIDHIDTKEIPAGSKDVEFCNYKNGIRFLENQEDDNESDYLYKFIVSTERINAVQLEQGFILCNIEPNTRSSSRGIPTGAKNNASNIVLYDWFTIDIPVHLTRTRTRNNIIKDKRVEIGRLSLTTHSDFSAQIGLGSFINNGRGLKETNLSLTNQELNLAPITNSNRGEATNDLIALTNIKGAVSKENPLIIRLNEPLNQNEYLIPMAIDGDFLIPIGFSEPETNLVKIQTIPEVESTENTKGFLSSLKLCLVKVIKDVIGVPATEIYKLRAVDYSNDKIEYISDESEIRERVNNSNKILLLTHGIIGDTLGMAEFASELVKNNVYDLVLTFDYENLNTDIENAAYQLKRRLIGEKKVYIDGIQFKGIGIGKDKKVDILAHSMGGLLSRYLIEKSEGRNFVNKLIMCGTPNGGSNFGILLPHILKGISIVTQLKINFIGNTLEQMSPDSVFIRKLNYEGQAGNIPYIVLAGDINHWVNNDASWWDKLIGKFYRVGGNIMNFDDPNDIAVKVEDVISCGLNENVESYDLPCHHLNYFVEENSVKKLMEILK